MGRTSTGDRPYLLLKANASQLPLSSDSISLVIATPPYLGVRCRPKADYCTNDPDEYHSLMSIFLTEATRIVKPRRHILLISGRERTGKSKGARRVVFHVIQKLGSRGHWTHQRIKSVTFLTHYVEVKNFPWWALSIRLYRNLIRCYSEPGEIVAHIFCGSGNGGIAALESARTPILVDSHYHRQARRRLEKRVQSANKSCSFSACRLTESASSYRRHNVGRSVELTKGIFR